MPYAVRRAVRRIRHIRSSERSMIFGCSASSRVNMASLTAMAESLRCYFAAIGISSGSMITGGLMILSDGRCLGHDGDEPRERRRNSWRCTTASTMPCSCRYSARWKPSGSFSRIVCSITRGPANPMRAPGSARLNISQHRIGGRDPARRWIGENDDIGKLRVAAGPAPRPSCAAAASATECLPACARRPMRQTAHRASRVRPRCAWR